MYLTCIQCRLGMKDASDACQEVKDKLHVAMDSLAETRRQNEASIGNRANVELQEAKVKLNINSPVYGYGKLRKSG